MPVAMMNDAMSKKCGTCKTYSKQRNEKFYGDIILYIIFKRFETKLFSNMIRIL